MARIFYGIMGDARGHLTRSLAVAGELAEHEFLFAGGGAVSGLRARNLNVVDIPMLETVLADGRVDGPATLRNTLRQLHGRKRTIACLAASMKEFRPDLAVTDYEYFTPHAARALGVPCVSLDNQHALTHCRYPRPPGQWLNRMLTCCSIRYLFSAADRYIISSFYQPPVVDDGLAESFPPVLPNDLAPLRPSSAGHGLVYVRGTAQEDVRRMLLGRPNPYIVYGFDGTGSEGNTRYKTASRPEFLEDLAACSHVICNGGHSLISEALHLGKPVFALPTRMFYEQYVNAHFLAVKGFGSYAMRRQDRRSALDKFESAVDGFAAEIRKHEFRGNTTIAEALRRLL